MSIRDKFSNLTQISNLLNLEKVIYKYYYTLNFY